ncbi:Adaptor protein complex AP-3 delta subunit [Polychytrium aggregatum]|uniref:Adaptor protein complex AP-3 delta subunit n=1 Tax=Polychytrium aggregatum TaxID=110093 RepID=UPI0022FEB088|nr:Adaptor protein complex AP-3 delta subunit [Polychytrium aggregatum]KAI9209645.1 Adaptor protein complex AP-3 delta subunit [Polychytrium aggregatum]
MFEKTLTDLIRGIRSNKGKEDAFIAKCIAEIRQEIKRDDPDLRAIAISKLAYLHMLGYDMSWASFHVIEVMSSPKIAYKRIGYTAASQSFRQDTDVLMLCTNLIKKDLSSNYYQETAVALHGLAQIVTPDLGRDLTPDLIAMLTHSKPYIRKRVILVLYRVFLKHPDTLRIAFPRLRERLEDPDPSVVSAAVSVICELARKNPKSYLPMAPQLYGLLNNSSNNWMLIKIVKLFAALLPLEPRLVKKLVPPLTSLIQSTPAMSLLYECILTVINGGMIGGPGSGTENEAQDNALTDLCIEKIKLLIEDRDQNLKYLGLYALAKLLPIRPQAVLEHKDIVIACLDDSDVSIRYRALDLISGMVTKGNLINIVKKLQGQLTLLDHPFSGQFGETEGRSRGSKAAVTDAKYEREVINKIVKICSQNMYENITNFEWYIGVLARLAYVQSQSIGELLAKELIDVTVRVRNVRQFAVNCMVTLLADKILLETATDENTNVGVLSAAAWICGEYSSLLSSPPTVLHNLLDPAVLRLPHEIQAVYVHNILKIYTSWSRSLDTAQVSHEDFVSLTGAVVAGLKEFSTSLDLEVQERATMSLVILSDIDLGAATDEWAIPPILTEVSSLFAAELNPVAPRAQRKVPVPDGLDLDTWIYPPVAEKAVSDEDELRDEDLEDSGDELGFRAYAEHTKKKSSATRASDAEARKASAQRKKQNDPFYLPASTPTPQKETALVDDLDQSVPIVDLKEVLGAAKPKKTKKTKKSVAEAASPVPAQVYEINTQVELPEGVTEADLEHDVTPPSQSIDDDTAAVMSVTLDFSTFSSRGTVAPATLPDSKGKVKASKKKAAATKDEVAQVTSQVDDLVITRKKVKKTQKVSTSVVASAPESVSTSQEQIQESVDTSAAQAKPPKPKKKSQGQGREQITADATEGTKPKAKKVCRRAGECGRQTE